MQIKTTLRYHLTPGRMASIKKAKYKCWQACRERGTLLHYWWECKLVQPLWKAIWRFLKNINTIWPWNPTPWNLPKEYNFSDSKRHMHPYVYTALFIIAKIWKQPKCPSVNEWIKKRWYIYTMEYYSAIRKKQILPFATTWMELEGIMLSEISQAEKDKYHMISLLNKTKQNKQNNSRLIDTEK